MPDTTDAKCKTCGKSLAGGTGALEFCQAACQGIWLTAEKMGELSLLVDKNRDKRG